MTVLRDRSNWNQRSRAKATAERKMQVRGLALGQAATDAKRLGQYPEWLRFMQTLQDQRNTIAERYHKSVMSMQQPGLFGDELLKVRESVMLMKAQLDTLDGVLQLPDTIIEAHEAQDEAS